MTRSSQLRHRRVVGCPPVPNASPGSRTMLSAAGSGAACQLGTTHSRGEILIGANCACVSRTQSRSATARTSLGGGASPARAHAAASNARASASPGTSARTRLLRHSRALSSPASANQASSRADPAAASSTSTAAAPASSSASITASASAAFTSKESDSQGIAGEAKGERKEEGFLLSPVASLLPVHFGELLLEVVDARAPAQERGVVQQLLV